MKTYEIAEDIAKDLNLCEQGIKEMNKLLEEFPMRIPDYYYSLIDFDDLDDPIMKMSIPTKMEWDPNGSFDTSGEQYNTRISGLQHKYRQTAMILTTNQCAMYCRHCFRKRLVGLSSEEIAKHLDAIFSYIEEHKEINNVLISGGDAFMNSNKTIERYLKRLTAIEHLDFIRFATRTPVTYPQRITNDPELIELLREYNEKKPLMVVTQFNHSNEITEESKAAIDALSEGNIPVKNQTVLLAGVNDDPDVLGELLKKLTSISVFPYYVFQCRPVTGVKSHFQVPIKHGLKVVEGAKKLQNGIGKSFRYCMSHPTGKIEILGEAPSGEVLFKYHETKNPEKDNGRIFSQELSDSQAWLNEIE